MHGNYAKGRAHEAIHPGRRGLTGNVPGSPVGVSGCPSIAFPLFACYLLSCSSHIYASLTLNVQLARSAGPQNRQSDINRR